MKKIRIQNDIDIKWRITTNGENVPLEGRKLALLITNTYQRTAVTDFTVAGNVVRFVFAGAQQRYCGVYTIVLQDTTDGMRTVDTVQAFELVRHSIDQSGEDDSNITTETVELASDMAAGYEGASAYEVAVKNGFSGSEAEWLASLRGADGTSLRWEDLTPEQVAVLQRPAVAAAELADAAAGRADKVIDAANAAAILAEKAALAVGGGVITEEEDVTSSLPTTPNRRLSLNSTIGNSSKIKLYCVDTTTSKKIRLFNATGDGVNNCYAYHCLNISVNEFSALPIGTDLLPYITVSGPLTATLPGAVLADSEWITVSPETKCVVVSNAATLGALRVLQEKSIVVKSYQQQIDDVGSELAAVKASLGDETKKKTVTLLGDSTMGFPKLFINNWCRQNGYNINIIQEGGNSALQLGAYIGAIPAFVKSSVTIPASGGVSIGLKSACAGSDGQSIDLILKHYNVEEGSFTLGLNPVTINGVAGNISHDASLNVASVCLYDSSGALIQYYDAASQGRTLTVNHAGVTGMRICINANSQTDVESNSAHVDINGGASVAFAPYLTHAATCLDTTGRLLPGKVGFYTSDLIPVSDPLITKLYMDGLADNVNVVFTRLKPGAETTVESGAALYSPLYEAYKDTIVLYYLNNIHRTGGAIQDDFINQMKPVADLSDRYILSTSHWAAHSFSTEQIQIIDAQMRRHFGCHQMSMYHYLAECGLRDVVKHGVLTTEQIGDLDWERVLLTNTQPIGGAVNIHENIYGAYLIARKFLERGADLGYWELGDVSFARLYSGGVFLS